MQRNHIGHRCRELFGVLKVLALETPFDCKIV